MGSRIDCYLDIASFYGYLAFVELQRARAALLSHGVQVEYHPVLLGAINAGSGNKPPWTLPAKRKYGVHDTRRSAERCGVPDIRVPPDFMARAMTVLPLRVLHAVKTSYSSQTFETTLHYFFYCFWSPPNLDLTAPSTLAQALGEMPSDFGRGSSPQKGGKLLFSPQDVESIMRAASSQEIKDSLRTTTQAALDKGAFGTPWFWVTNSAGHAEPFFGSDRFHFVYSFLGLPFQDIALLPRGEESESRTAKL